MNKIIQLSQHIISKIAAGEVIERPAYAVKELIENSIDAHADYIRIDIEGSGLHKIMITDNGEGMTKEDLHLSILPHTTSKIEKEDDLHNIQSMGFRGEALASISTVSNLTIRSKVTSEIAGNEINLEGNKLVNAGPVGMNSGTSVIVENLFSHTPPRKRFLRSLHTEYRHIVQVVINIALVHPEIRFILTNNRHPVLDLPKQSLEERMDTLLGKATTAHLIPVEFEKSYIKFHGFVSKPQLAQHSTSRSHIFVNKRPIKDTVINTTIRNIYGTLLPSTMQPVFILFFTLPTEMIDVNVHPRKEYLHFHDTAFVQEVLKESITNVLEKNNLTFQDARWKKTGTKNSLRNNFMIRDGNTESYAGELLKDTLTKDILTKKIIRSDDVLQINNVYILSQTSDTLSIIDQHAAHERILYEQLIHTFSSKKQVLAQYSLGTPLLIDLSLDQKITLEENNNQLTRMGFSMELLSGNTCKISAVPKLFKDRNITELLFELVADLAEETKHDLDLRTQRMLSYIACRSAVKAGDNLTKAQMKHLITELQKTPNNTTCPHGRPTRVDISLSDLHHLFYRK